MDDIGYEGQLDAYYDDVAEGEGAFGTEEFRPQVEVDEDDFDSNLQEGEL